MFRYLVPFSCLQFAIAGSAVAADSLRPVAVTDAIEMTRIIDPDPSNEILAGLQFKYSPDGKAAAVVTRRGNLATGLTEFRILIFDRNQSLDYINGRTAERPGRTLFTKAGASKSSWQNDAIDSLVWLDNDTLGCIVADDSGVTQAQALDAKSGRVRQLTRGSIPVLRFDADLRTGRTVFLGGRFFNASDASRRSSFPVLTTPFAAIVNPAKWDTYIKDYQHFVVAVPDGAAAPSGPAFPAPPPQKLSLSPDKRWAVSQLAVGEPDQERAFFERFPALGTDPYMKLVSESFDPYYMNRYSGVLQQFVVLDLDEPGKPWTVDAPTGALLGGYSNADAVWMPDGNSFILGNTFVPDDPGAGPVVAEVDVRTHRWSIIKKLAVSTDGNDRFNSVSLSSDGLLAIEVNGKKSFFRRKGKEWVVAAAKSAAAPIDGRLVLRVSQRRDQAPEIVGKDVATGKERQLTDLNPQLKSLRFGKSEDFDWKDKDGREWKGALIFPPDYESGRRYPLVVQTYTNFRKPHEFIIDGPYGMSSAYAAQPLASRGMLVLLYPNRRLEDGVDGFRGELTVHQAAVEAALDELDRRQLVDAQRIGIIGFSAYGRIVQQVMTYSDHAIAAASINDSFNPNFLQYALWGIGVGDPLMKITEGYLDAEPWGSRLKDWVDRDASFHVDRVRAAVMIQNYGATLDPYWATYALMRRLHKPVEMLVFPNGSHSLREPRERYDSLEGNVDWFDFWLRGHEDPDSAKAPQYARWREMRTLYCATFKEKTAKTPWYCG